MKTLSMTKDLLEAIDKSEEVYTNSLNSLFEKDMMELSVEMEVLKTVFAMPRIVGLRL